MWFMHDGAPAHFARIARDLLGHRNYFGNRWIGRSGPVACPPPPYTRFKSTRLLSLGSLQIIGLHPACTWRGGSSAKNRKWIPDDPQHPMHFSASKQFNVSATRGLYSCKWQPLRAINLKKLCQTRLLAMYWEKKQNMNYKSVWIQNKMYCSFYFNVVKISDFSLIWLIL